MSEYINADALRAYLVKREKEFDKAVSEHRIEQGTAALAHAMLKGIMDAIGGCDLPFAADVIPVVRCAECERSEPYFDSQSALTCREFGCTVPRDGFCHEGRRNQCLND